MPQYIAFLRGINVGSHRVRMDRLKELFEDLGFDDVWTFIASGNVIFRAKSTKPEALTKKIEKHLKAALGYDVPTILRTPTELSGIVSVEPFAAEICSDTDDLYVILLTQSAPSHAAEHLAAVRTDADEFFISEREVYWLRRKQISESKIAARVFLKAFGQPGTSRNMTTLKKLNVGLDR